MTWESRAMDWCWMQGFYLSVKVFTFFEKKKRSTQHPTKVVGRNVWTPSKWTSLSTTLWGVQFYRQLLQLTGVLTIRVACLSALCIRLFRKVRQNALVNDMLMDFPLNVWNIISPISMRVEPGHAAWYFNMVRPSKDNLCLKQMWKENLFNYWL